MTESKRQKQIGEVIRRHFGTVLQNEGTYIYGTAFVTVMKVYVSPDISLAKIYLSIYNVDNKEEILEKIRFNAHLLKKNLASRIKKHIRRIPEISFFIDETLDEIYRVNELLDDTLKKDQEIRNEKE
jgi:ribosome-binding factor A